MEKTDTNIIGEISAHNPAIVVVFPSFQRVYRYPLLSKIKDMIENESRDIVITVQDNIADVDIFIKERENVSISDMMCSVPYCCGNIDMPLDTIICFYDRDYKTRIVRGVLKGNYNKPHVLSLIGVEYTETSLGKDIYFVMSNLAESMILGKMNTCYEIQYLTKRLEEARCGMFSLENLREITATSLAVSCEDIENALDETTTRKHKNRDQRTEQGGNNQCQ